MSIGRLLFATAGIYASYLAYGVVQEYIYSHKDAEGKTFTFTLTLLFIQCTINALAAFLYTRFESHAGGPRTLKDVGLYAIPGFTYIAAMLCSNEALLFVGYPTQALAKSCKMVPVMGFNILWYGKRYTFLEYCYVILVTAGIAIFRLKSSEDEASSTYGLLLLLASLIFDGITGPKQEALRERFHTSVHQPMLYCNSFALVFLSIALFAYGEHLDGFRYLLLPENQQLLNYVLIFSVASAFGQNFIFYAIHHLGSLMCATITTTRKFFTILFSVFLYGHILSSQQWAGVLMVFAGLSMELHGKYIKKKPSEKTL